MRRKLLEIVMNKKARTFKIFIVIIVGIFIVAGIPLIINETYKVNTGYLTLWGAADVLSYYGMILGALLTIFALVVTITFTKRQIQRDSYLKAEKEKWNKIETEIVKALDAINPARASDLINQSLSQNRDETIVSLRSCMLRAETAGDALRGYINKNDEHYLQPLLLTIKKYTEKYDDLIDRVTTQFFNLQLLEKAIHATETLQRIQSPADRLSFQLANRALFSATRGMNADAIADEVNSLKNQLEDLRNNEYLELLDQKREVFASIQKNIEQNANELLDLWRK